MELKKTITSIFIVPTLKISREGLLNNGFINGYIKDIQNQIEYEDAVFLLFKPKNPDKFKDFIDKEYERTPSIIDDYDYEGGYVVAVYLIDNKYKNDIELVKEGKYSKTSKEFKSAFPKVIKITKNGLHRDEVSLQWRIFSKSDDLKEYWENKLAVDLHEDMEVWDTWELDKEILDIEKIKQYV